MVSIKLCAKASIFIFLAFFHFFGIFQAFFRFISQHDDYSLRSTQTSSSPCWWRFWQPDSTTTTWEFETADAHFGLFNYYLNQVWSKWSLFSSFSFLSKLWLCFNIIGIIKYSQMIAELYNWLRITESQMVMINLAMWEILIKF